MSVLIVGAGIAGPQIQMDPPHGSWTCGRVLVGDAAICVSLLAGQGSALAMVAAYLLAGGLCRWSSNRVRIRSADATAVHIRGSLANRDPMRGYSESLYVPHVCGFHLRPNPRC